MSDFYRHARRECERFARIEADVQGGTLANYSNSSNTQMARKKNGSSASSDHVDQVIADWKRERPDLDTAPVAIVARIGRLQIFLDAGLERVLGPFGLTRASWDVLATLRRAGAPYRLHQKSLMRALMRTSGTTSFRIDRLEHAGLVRREPDPNDRRGIFVTLTQKGRKLFDAVAPAHLANERSLVAGLSGADRETLAGLLRNLLLTFERPAEP